MAWVKLYERIGWENVPSTKSPINDLNLNKIDIAVDAMDDRVIELQTTKAEQSDLLTSVKDVDVNQTTGVITITFNNNTTKTFDTVLEKVVTNFRYDATTQSLILTLADGTTQSIPLSEFITQNEFLNSDRITFSVSEGKVRADLIKGSITGDYLQPNYLADITAQASLAGASATAAATSEANAAQSAQTASTKATEASQSATTASTKADEASASATTASTKASEATTAAQTATTKASEASTSAQTAATKATEAATSASNASTSETNAQNSATAANTKAEEASASADRAEQAAQSTEGTVKYDDTDGYVGRNLIENLMLQSQLVAGLSYEVAEDKSIKVNGTKTVDAGSIFINKDSSISLIGEKIYILNGGYERNDNIWIAVIDANNTSIVYARSYGEPVEFTVSSNVDVVVGISTIVGVTANNLIIKPMLVKKGVPIEPYVPYLPKNSDIEGKISYEQNLLGVKNILPSMPYGWGDGSGTVTSNGVTYTINDDYTITQDGTASGGHGNIFTYNNVNANSNKFKLPYGVKVGDKLRLTGCPAGGASNTYYLRIMRINRIYQDYSRAIVVTDTGRGATWTVSQEDLDAYGFVGQICLDNGNSASNRVFNPMLILDSMQDNTYAPPTMTNLQLTMQVQDNTDVLNIPNKLEADLDTVTKRFTRAGGATANTPYTQTPSISGAQEFFVETPKLNAFQVQRALCIDGVFFRRTNNEPFNNTPWVGIMFPYKDVSGTRYIIHESRFDDGVRTQIKWEPSTSKLYFNACDASGTWMGDKVIATFT